MKIEADGALQKQIAELIKAIQSLAAAAGKTAAEGSIEGFITILPFMERFLFFASRKPATRGLESPMSMARSTKFAKTSLRSPRRSMCAVCDQILDSSSATSFKKQRLTFCWSSPSGKTANASCPRTSVGWSRSFPAACFFSGNPRAVSKKRRR